MGNLDWFSTVDPPDYTSIGNIESDDADSIYCFGRYANFSSWFTRMLTGQRVVSEGWVAKYSLVQ